MGSSSQKEKTNEIQYDTELDLQILREDLAAELLAINQYQEHVESLTDEDAIRVLEHIRDEKKEHVSQLFKVIRKLEGVHSRKLTKAVLR